MSPGRRGETGDVVQVFHRERNAVERAAIDPRAKYELGSAGLGERAIGDHDDKGVQPWVEPTDSIQQLLGESDGSHLAPANASPKISD